MGNKRLAKIANASATLSPTSPTSFWLLKGWLFSCLEVLSLVKFKLQRSALIPRGTKRKGKREENNDRFSSYWARLT